MQYINMKLAHAMAKKRMTYGKTPTYRKALSETMKRLHAVAKQAKQAKEIRAKKAEVNSLGQEILTTALWNYFRYEGYSIDNTAKKVSYHIDSLIEENMITFSMEQATNKWTKETIKANEENLNWTA